MTATEGVPLQVVLASTYELGRQPFGLASAAAWAKDAGASVNCFDLAVERIDDEALSAAQLIGFYLPMHTATRLATSIARDAKKLNPSAHLCFFGLYASTNYEFLRKLGADTVLGGEFEEGLYNLVLRLARPGDDAQREQVEPVVSVARQRFKVPDRSGLPDLSLYAYLTTGSGATKTVGYTEASRGCKHLCRHCPIVPVYNGRFRVVQRQVVLQDIANQVSAGAEHITFGDPDFFNGPGHAMAVVNDLHRRFPHVTYDVTIKVEHLIKQAKLLPDLRATGCVLITTAVESFDEATLNVLEKSHSRDDIVRVVQLIRKAGIGFNPTFVAFTPWTTRLGYVEFLNTLLELGLVANVAPVQYAIRLLIPQGSRLLELDEVRDLVGDDFDHERLSFRWRHPDPGVDELFLEVDRAVRDGLARDLDRREIFSSVMALAHAKAAAATSNELPVPMLVGGPKRRDEDTIPYLSEPWYC